MRCAVAVSSLVAFILGVNLAATSQSPAQSTAPVTAPADSTLDTLVAQLGSDDWSSREAAQDKLVALGAAAVERLQRVAKESVNDEVRQRADAALAQISQNESIGPSVITLHLHDMPVRNAFADLSRQAHTNLQTMPAELWDVRAWPAVTLDIEGKPFWTALRELGDATGVELRAWNEGLRLMQATGGAGGGVPGWTNGRSAVCGAFLITLRQCSRTQTIEYTPSGETRNSDFSLTFQATAEPKLRVLRAAYLAKLEEATDDAGNSLVFGGAGADNKRDDAEQPLEAAFVPGPGGTWTFSARLAYPRSAPLGRQIKSLRGGVKVLLQTRAQAIEITNVMSAQNQTRSAGGLKLTLSSFKKVGERYDATLAIARDRLAMPRDTDWQQVQQNLNEIRLLDDQGRAFNGSNTGTGGSDDSIEVTMSFVRDESAMPPPAALNLNPPNAAPGAPRALGLPSPDPSKLVWQVPIEVKEITIPFEFGDVPLPE